MNEDYPFISDKKSLYKEHIIESVYIPMRDGVKIAAEVLLPKGLPEGKKIPTILVQTRYWRSASLKKPFKWLIKFSTNPMLLKNIPKYGFALIETDVRGTGASYGTRPYPFSEEEIKDGAEVVDWIIKQSWSDGNVVTWGNSYTGITSELTATLNHPALKCHLVKHPPAWDAYPQVMFPGGCFNEYFIKYWSSLGQGLDQTDGKALLAFKPVEPLIAKLGPKAAHGVKSVTGEREILNEIAEIHKQNKYPYDYGEKIVFRDDLANDDGTTIDDISIFTKKEKIEKNNVPLYTFGSWQDSSTASLVISRFLLYKNPIKAVIGDWDHNGIKKANPYFSHKVKVIPGKEDQIKDWINYYEECISGNVPEKALYYFTMGEEKWKKTTTWPPKGQTKEKWYLAENNSLSQEKSHAESGSDEYEVDYETTTGIRNRWYTLLSLRVIYENRKEEEARCIIYTSAPLQEDIEITGHPVVKLLMSSTHEDGMVHAHFEFIDEKGVIHWITDGQLRFIHRKISDEEPPYKIFTPYHSFLKKDNLPLVPGEVAEISFGMQPTSLIVKKGYRLRVVIAGADKETFARYPKDESITPTFTIERNKVHASYIELPIIKK